MKPTILFVDDEGGVRRGIQRMLWEMEEEWHLLFCESGEEALMTLYREHVDVLVTDHNMPGMTGLELIEEVRKYDCYASIPIVMLTGCNDRTLKRQAIDSGATDLLHKPAEPEDLIARIKSVLMLKASRDALSSQNERLERLVAERTRQLEYSRFELVLRLSKCSQIHDFETGNHNLRVGLYSKILASNLGLDREYQETILLAAPMHDIGKLAVSDTILRKPARLDPEEMEAMRTHARIGHELLSEEVTLNFELDSVPFGFQEGVSPFMKMAGIIALQHHEKWDGTGYPQGLKGEEIDISARIVALADVFDALGSTRPYKKAFPHEQVIELIYEESGKHFDPSVVEAFGDSLPELERIRQRLGDEPTPLAA